MDDLVGDITKIIFPRLAEMQGSTLPEHHPLVVSNKIARQLVEKLNLVHQDERLIEL